MGGKRCFRHLSITKFQGQCNFSGNVYLSPDSLAKSNQSFCPSYAIISVWEEDMFFLPVGERNGLCGVGDLTLLVIYISIQVQFPFEGLRDFLYLTPVSYALFLEVFPKHTL